MYWYLVKATFAIYLFFFFFFFLKFILFESLIKFLDPNVELLQESLILINVQYVFLKKTRTLMLLGVTPIPRLLSWS